MLELEVRRVPHFFNMFVYTQLSVQQVENAPGLFVRFALKNKNKLPRGWDLITGVM